MSAVAAAAWDGTTAGWRRWLEVLAALPCRIGSVKALNDSLAPGFYVSAINDHGQKALVEGPYTRHEEALVRVQAVKDAWSDADPRAFWYAWGTARVRP